MVGYLPGSIHSQRGETLQFRNKHYRLVLANGEVFDDVVIHSAPGGGSFYVIDVFLPNDKLRRRDKQLHVRREFIGYFEDDNPRVMPVRDQAT